MNRYRPYSSRTVLYTVALLLASGRRVYEYVRLSGDEREEDAQRAAIARHPFSRAMYVKQKAT